MGAFRDVVILLPGITGSVLANARKEVWAPSGGAVWRAVASFGKSITGLELAADGGPGDVVATRLVPDVTIVPGLVKIDGYSRIEQHLVGKLGLEPGRNYFPFPYDWRLDNRVNARALETKAMQWLTAWRRSSGAADARLVLVGHSMGGLVSRYFLECLGGWRDTRALFTLGTPHRGSLNAVDFLVHGMKKGIGPLGLDMTPLLRSLPSVYQLLPIYPCVDAAPGELAYIADAAAAGALPEVDADRARQARAFHQEIEDAQEANARQDAYRERGYRLQPMVGNLQPTYQSARSRGGKVELLRSRNGQDDGGDGTVPCVSAIPIEMSDALDRVIYAADTHGSLQNEGGVLATLGGRLKDPSVDLKTLRDEGLVKLSLDADEAVLPGEPLVVRARASQDNPRISVRLVHAGDGETIEDAPARDPETGGRIGEYDLSPGVWRITISADGATPVTDLAVVAA